MAKDSLCIHFEFMPSLETCFTSFCIVYNVVCHLTWETHKTGETLLDGNVAGLQCTTVWPGEPSRKTAWQDFME